ncbi:hypothetical protein BT63DRAFT_416086 [Microthyrium microscopicum]|uniref:N-acetyltransferase domain-containing protein n=1 Tax=Microthyrium microscopicum TaxID=703497 RepID=A0A6A6U7T8_9PEZI|nr:hypothetical protein BT63DRAFT_416086 [Microthyrium microscopicum]
MLKAVLDDPARQPIYRTSGEPPYDGPSSGLPDAIQPRRVTLRDRITSATLIPVDSITYIPLSLLSYLSKQMNREIEKGDTYAMTEPMALAAFGSYWFSNFVAIMLLGDWGATTEEALTKLGGTLYVETDWEKECIGSFYIKPNYPGRSSHVCNGTFLVTDGARNRGVGRLMGETYVEWAPKLGYTYSVFNLVYETNVASCKIWDALGFKRIGRVKGCGHLKSHDEPVDAIIFGRELDATTPEDFATDERFDKIKYYLKHAKYPDGATRAEKSRLRSAATHYRLILENTLDASGQQEEKLYLKDKEVISDPQRQYDVAREMHELAHEGINKTTARVAERYHWVRIKETATLVIKNCQDCVEPGKSAAPMINPAQPHMLTANGIPVLFTQMPVSQFSAINQTATPSQPGILIATMPEGGVLQVPTSAQFTMDEQSMMPLVTAAAAMPATTIPDMMGYENMPVDPNILLDENAVAAGFLSDLSMDTSGWSK